MMAQCNVRNINQVQREGNKSADLLAKQTFNFSNFSAINIVLSDPPSFLLQQLGDDAVGVKYPRTCFLSVSM